MILAVVAVAGTLVRSALATILTQEADMYVVAELSDAQQMLRVARRHPPPDVLVLDTELQESVESLEDNDLGYLLPESRHLVLVDVQKPSAIARVSSSQIPQVGYIPLETSPAKVVEAVRLIARGDPVLDPQVAVAVLTAAENPLTERERKILAIVAEGAPVKEIANRLYLATGTVRNNISRILAKTGASTRLEAYRIAREAGWL